jgi:hypothetical protein
MKLAIYASLIFLVGCGAGGSSTSSEPSAGPYVYSESTVDQFVSSCLLWPGASVSKCACVLEEQRAQTSEAEFRRAMLGDQPFAGAGMFDKCELAAPPLASSPVSTAPSASEAGLAAAGPTLPPATPPASTVRKATDTETCVQEKLMAAQAAAGGGSVSLKVLDAIRAECS